MAMGNPMMVGADTGGVNYDPTNQGGGFNWDQYTGGVTGGTTAAPQQSGTMPNANQWDQSTFTQMFGAPNTPQELEALEQRLNAAGIRVSRNASGVAGKIILPNGQYVDVINSAGLGGRGFQWLTDSGGGQGGQAGGAQPYNFSTDDPSYQWRLQQGLEGVQKSAAANGTLLTGGTLKDLTAFGQGMASTEYQNAFGRKNTLADLGLRAAGGQASAGTSYGNGASDQLSNIGNANSAGSVAQANIWGKYLNNLGAR